METTKSSFEITKNYLFLQDLYYILYNRRGLVKFIKAICQFCGQQDFINVPLYKLFLCS